MPLNRRATFKTCTGAALLLTLGSAWAQTKWDFPTAYPAHNFHTENITQFVQDVDKATMYGGGARGYTDYPTLD